jgi:p21-activated kinase 1
VWSLGVLIFEMIDGEPPYMELPPLQALFKISNEPVPKPKKDSTPSLNSFMQRCLCKDVALRPPASELLADPFLETACSPREMLAVCDQAEKLREATPFNY